MKGFIDGFEPGDLSKWDSFNWENWVHERFAELERQGFAQILDVYLLRSVVVAVVMLAGNIHYLGVGEIGK